MRETFYSRNLSVFIFLNIRFYIKTGKILHYHFYEFLYYDLK